MSIMPPICLSSTKPVTCKLTDVSDRDLGPGQLTFHLQISILMCKLVDYKLQISIIF